MHERPLLRERTRELYEGLLRLHVLPSLGAISLCDIKPAVLRTWHASTLSGPRLRASTAAKTYRLLRSILATAVDDELIEKNPCRIRGAGVEHPKERPIATIEQVYAIADAIEPRYRALVLTATFTSLRLGELRALTCRNLDLLHATVHVAGQLQELKEGTLFIAPPKTAAGVRTVSIPQALIPELEEHLARWSGGGPEAWVFVGTRDQPFRRGSLYTAWRRALRAVGMEDLHFHDLRHTGATLAAATGATPKELMARLGHASPRAALIYQHATQAGDRAIAAAFDDKSHASFYFALTLPPSDPTRSDPGERNAPSPHEATSGALACCRAKREAVRVQIGRYGFGKMDTRALASRIDRGAFDRPSRLVPSRRSVSRFRRSGVAGAGIRV